MYHSRMSLADGQTNAIDPFATSRAREFRNGLSLKDYAAHAIVGMGAAVHLLGYIARADYLYSVAYLRAISLTCSRVSCFGGTPGGPQVSRKKPSKPGGAMIQSRSSS